MTGFFVDAGPHDHGALFGFVLGVLPAGETRTIYFYHGVTADEASAIDALTLVGAQGVLARATECSEWANARRTQHILLRLTVIPTRRSAQR